MKKTNQENLKIIGCVHFNQCSGCVINDVADLPLFVDVHRFFKEKGIEIKLHAGSPTAWRMRAKVAVRGSWKKLLIGLYKEKTHDVVDIPFCKTHHPSINAAIERVRSLIQSEQLMPYDEISAKGELRYLQCAVERSTGKIQLTFVLNATLLSKHWNHALEKLWKEKQDNLFHSNWINYNTAKNNVILGQKWEHLFGQPLLWEIFGETKVCFQPASFAQANLMMFDSLLESLKKYVPKESKVVEYYAGVGVIGLILAAQCRQVLCCEINAEAEFCFRHSQKLLAENQTEKISFRTGDANDLLHLMAEADVVIADPPRKGLDSAFLNALKKATHVQTFIYISCGWPAFQRDCEALIVSGWNLSSAEAYLFFPGSNHVEILAIFKRS